MVIKLTENTTNKGFLYNQLRKVLRIKTVIENETTLNLKCQKFTGTLVLVLLCS